MPRAQVRRILVLVGVLLFAGCTGADVAPDETESLPEVASLTPSPSGSTPPPATTPTPSPTPPPPMVGQGELALSAFTSEVTGDCTLWGLPAAVGPLPAEAQVLLGVTNQQALRADPEAVAVSLSATGTATPLSVRVDGGPDPVHRAFAGSLDGALLTEVGELDGIAVATLEVAGTITSTAGVASLPAPMPAPPPPATPAPTAAPTPSPSASPGEPTPVAPAAPSPPLAVELALEVVCRVLPGE